MAAAQLIAVGIAAADATEFDVTASAPVAVGLYEGFRNEARVQIKIKDPAGGFTLFYELTADKPLTVISAPGTYKVSRLDKGAVGQCGVFRGA